MAKLVAMIALVGLVAWLALDHSPQEAKWRSLAAAFDRGDIGHLPDRQANDLKELVAWLAPYAHITGSASINERPRAGCLNILTTKPTAVAVTGCASGNAIYDSTLDTVFIDESIAWPRDIPKIGGDQAGVAFTPSVDLEFPTVYLRFILAHEFGHRFLHRGQAVFFDAANVSRRMESEADDFAIETLKAAYADDLKNGGHRVGRGSASSLQLATADLPPAERVWADLVGTASSMSEALMFSASDFSTFYEDRAHPTFLNRAAAIFSLALQSANAGTRLKSHASFYLNSLRRTEQMKVLPILEWQTHGPVTGVAFDSSGIVALTDGGDLRAVALGPTGPNAGVHPISDDRIIATHSSLGSKQYTHGSILWGCPQLGPVVLFAGSLTGADALVVVQAGAGGNYVPLPSLTAAFSGASSNDDVASGPQPSHFAIVGLGTRTGGGYRIARDGQIVGSGKWNDLRAKVQSALKLPTAALDLGTVTEDTAYLTIVEVQQGHEQIRGVAAFDLAHNKLGKVVQLTFEYEEGGEAFSIPGDRLVVVPVEGQPSYFLVTRNARQFLVFELFPDRPTHQVSIQSFMLDSPMGADSTSDLLAAFDPHVYETKWVPPHSIAASFRGDSVFVIDVLSGKAKMVFNPGGRVRLAVSASGALAIFALNGYKVYVENPAALSND